MVKKHIWVLATIASVDMSLYAITSAEIRKPNQRHAGRYLAHAEGLRSQNDPRLESTFMRYKYDFFMSASFSEAQDRRYRLLAQYVDMMPMGSTADDAETYLELLRFFIDKEKNQSTEKNKVMKYDVEKYLRWLDALQKNNIMRPDQRGRFTAYKRQLKTAMPYVELPERSIRDEKINGYLDELEGLKRQFVASHSPAVRRLFEEMFVRYGYEGLDAVEALSTAQQKRYMKLADFWEDVGLTGTSSADVYTYLRIIDYITQMALEKDRRKDELAIKKMHEEVKYLLMQIFYIKEQLQGLNDQQKSELDRLLKIWKTMPSFAPRRSI